MLGMKLSANPSRVGEKVKDGFKQRGKEIDGYGFFEDVKVALPNFPNAVG